MTVVRLSVFIRRCHPRANYVFISIGTLVNSWLMDAVYSSVKPSDCILRLRVILITDVALQLWANF